MSGSVPLTSAKSSMTPGGITSSVMRDSTGGATLGKMEVPQISSMIQFAGLEQVLRQMSSRFGALDKRINAMEGYRKIAKIVSKSRFFVKMSLQNHFFFYRNNFKNNKFQNSF